MTRWEQIFEIISASSRMLNKYEIADELYRVYGVNVKPNSVVKYISEKWKEGKFSIYAEKEQNHNVYGVDIDYYSSAVNRFWEVEFI